MSGATCPECVNGKHGNCDGSAWDDAADAATACTCTHPIVTGPGIYRDLDEAVYHADTALVPHLGRSLSVSGAKLILDCPAKFAYRRDTGEQVKAVFDFGHVAHMLILGVGRGVWVVDATDWRKQWTKDAADTARAAGLVPLLRKDFLIATRMRNAVRRHPIASRILSQGTAEVSFYWEDQLTGVTLRGRVDWLRDNAIVDVKTTIDASPRGFAKQAANFGYHLQAPMYQDGIEALTGKRLPFVFIAVEKEAPHLVGVYTLDGEALSVGAEKNRAAIDVYASCESSGVWPAWSDDVEELSLPRWATY